MRRGPWRLGRGWVEGPVTHATVHGSAPALLQTHLLFYLTINTIYFYKVLFSKLIIVRKVLLVQKHSCQCWHTSEYALEGIM